MENPLDEQILDASSPPPFFKTIFVAFIIYFVLLTIGFVIYYTLGEQFTPFMPEIFIDIFVLFLITLVFLIPGYFLQKKIYPLFNNSVSKTTLVPVIFWAVIIALSFLGSLLEPSIEAKNLPSLLFVLLVTMFWLASLSFIISQYIAHQNNTKFFLYVLAHFIFFMVSTSVYQLIK